MKIIKGDTVVITSGKDKGKKSKVLRGFPKQNKILVEGVNIKKKHIKPKKEGEKGQVVEIAYPISISNTKIVCPNCGKSSRVGYLIEKGIKLRVCKKCNKTI